MWSISFISVIGGPRMVGLVGQAQVLVFVVSEPCLDADINSTVAHRLINQMLRLGSLFKLSRMRL